MILLFLMNDSRIEITEDGSHTLYVPGIDEHYHSTHGAVAESVHVYVDAGLRQCVKPEIKVLEIGFGTGLNAFLSMLEAEKTSKKIDYTSLELYPIPIPVIEKLNYAKLIAPDRKDVFRMLHSSAWGQWKQISIYFSLLKLQIDFSKPSSFCPENKFDVVFFDAFAPEKQPEMWTQEIFDAIYSFCAPEAILTTYCAKGAVRRMMQTAGFSVERLPGPRGKREILRARK